MNNLSARTVITTRKEEKIMNTDPFSLYYNNEFIHRWLEPQRECAFAENEQSLSGLNIFQLERQNQGGDDFQWDPDCSIGVLCEKVLEAGLSSQTLQFRDLVWFGENRERIPEIWHGKNIYAAGSVGITADGRRLLPFISCVCLPQYRGYVYVGWSGTPVMARTWDHIGRLKEDS